MYKKSRYNVEIEQIYDNSLLVYNSFTTSLCVLDKNTQEFYNKIGSPNAVNEHPAIESFLSNGFIVPELCDEESLFMNEQLQLRNNSNILNLTIAPTLNCNMGCKYCFEKDLKLKANMTPEIINQIIRFVKEKVNESEFEMLQVAWYGGEPLLKIDTIVELSSKFIEICDEKKLVYNATIITNGLLLNERNASILKDDCMVNNVQITIDGLKNTHNKRRTSNDGSESFERIIKNIDDNSEMFNYSIRTNIDYENINETIELIDYFESKSNWKDNIVYYFSKVEDYSGCNLKNCVSNSDYFDFLSRTYQTLSLRKYSKYFLSTYPQKTVTFCSAICKDNYVLDPFGDIYSCWSLIGNKDEVLGNIFEPSLLNREKWLNFKYSEKCTGCELVPSCHGGCPMIQILHPKECYQKIDSFKNYISEFYSCNYME
ncbi:radical SAM protein [Fusibacter bizertensis]